MHALIARSQTIVVMAERGRQILVEKYNVSPHRVTVIPHGIPDRELVDPQQMRRELGWPEVPTVLSFGLLSPGKGHRIDDRRTARTDRDRTRPPLCHARRDASAHRAAGRREAYRESLQARATELGVRDNVDFDNRFVELKELCDCLQASDVYVRRTCPKCRLPRARSPMRMASAFPSCRRATGTLSSCSATARSSS